MTIAERPNSEKSKAEVRWRAMAACKGIDSDIFFSNFTKDADAARAICAKCPVKPDCLEYAIANKETEGIWGGTSEIQRKNIVRARNANRTL